MAAATDLDRRGGRLGIMVPSSNTNLEPDCGILVPAGVTAHFTRLGGYDVEAVPGSREMRDLAMVPLDVPLDLLSAAGVNVIGYGCVSATLSCGGAFDRRFCREMEARAGVPVVSAAGAMLEAVRTIGARRIGFTSPYVGELNQKAVDFFAEAGIQVVSRVDLGTGISSIELGLLTPGDAFELGSAADHGDADAIVIGCTDFRAVEAVGALERKLGKPVITANQALVFACLARIGVHTEGIEGGGRLFTTGWAGNSSVSAGLVCGAPTG